MRARTRKLTSTALMAAVAVVLLYLSSVMPTGRIAFAAVAGICSAVCVIESGLAWGFACWICAGALGILITPDKGGAIIYALFFGLYPVLKSLLERIKSRVAEWALKLACFNAALTLCWLAYKLGFLAEDMLDKWALWIVYIAGSAVFVIYDIGFSRLIAFYVARVASKRNRK